MVAPALHYLRVACTNYSEGVVVESRDSTAGRKNPYTNCSEGVVVESRDSAAGRKNPYTNYSEGVVLESRDSAAGRKNPYTSFLHQGKTVCPRYFRFLHAIA